MAGAPVKSAWIELEMLRDPHCGIGQFCVHLAEELVRAMPADFGLTLLVPPECRSDWLGRASTRSLAHFQRLKWQSWFRSFGSLWHTTHQDSRYGPVGRAVRHLLTIHDLNFLEETQDADRKAERMRELRKQVARTDVLAFDSHFVAEEARRHLDLDHKPIQVIHLGAESAPCPDLPPPAGLDPSRPFLFAIGLVLPKKNFHVLVDMVRGLPDHQLVIAGYDRKPYGVELRKRIREAGLDTRVFMPGNIDEDQKWWFYHRCEALVFPSLLEGFGIPVLEAMNCGKPVFLARRTSLPEVGGAEAFYWEGFDPDEMREVFLAGMADYRRGAYRARRIREWAARFTWKAAAQKYLDLYRRWL